MSLKLNLGCGNDIREGYCNVDIDMHEGVDVAHDLNKRPWPWSVNSVDEIVAVDVLEHLDDYLSFFNEAYQVLRDGCEITVQVPHYTSRNYWIDPTHRRAYDERSFDYLDTTTELGQKYGQYYTKYRWRVVKVTRDYESGNITAVLRTAKTLHKPAFMQAFLAEPNTPVTPDELAKAAEDIANQLLSLDSTTKLEVLTDIKNRNETLYHLIRSLMSKQKGE